MNYRHIQAFGEQHPESHSEAMNAYRQGMKDALKDDERCAWCNEPMYTIVQAHHHTEDGKDVTRAPKLTE